MQEKKKKTGFSYFVITFARFLDADEEFFCDNARYKDIVRKYRGKGFYQKDFEEVLTRIINTDEEIEKGNIEYLGERRDATKFNLHRMHQQQEKGRMKIPYF